MVSEVATPQPNRWPSATQPARPSRVMPHDISMEQSILGGVILLGAAALDDLTHVETDDFYHPAHRIVWDAMRNLVAASQPIDVVTLENEIAKNGKLDAIGGIAFLGELALKIPTVDNLRSYRDTVLLLSANRRAILELSTALERAYSWQHDPTELLSETIGSLERFAETDKRRSQQLMPWTTAPDLVDAIMERAHDPWVGLTLGGDELARVRVGATVVLIGGSGSGKSSLTLDILAEHAKHVGPGILLSIELPGDEAGGRLVGIKCDASWEDALRGRVERVDMMRALDLPRLYVLDRRRATLENLEKCIDAARKAHPNQPIMVAIDYAQLLDSNKREVRDRVADVFARIDDVAREKKVAVLALSQMSRANAKKARDGEAIGAESADLGAEAAAIERFATLTIAIGKSVECEDGSTTVEISVGKARMGKGDKVYPAKYWGKSGLWRVIGDAESATAVREKRDVEKVEKRATADSMQILGLLSKSDVPMSRNQVIEILGLGKPRALKAISKLKGQGDIVEIAKHAPRSKAWLIWTPDKARQAGAPLVEGDLFGGDK